MSDVVLDASALLALLNDEPGGAEVARILPTAMLSAVNICEVVGRLAEKGMPEAEIQEALSGLQLDIRPFGLEAAIRAGMLRPLTKALGLSLGDRACLALGQLLALPVLTADRVWTDLDIGIQIKAIR